MRAPFASPAKAEKVWPALLDIQLPFPLNGAVFHCIAPTRTPDGQVETLAIAARREDSEAWQRALSGSGFPPWILDHEGLALWSQSVEEQPLEKQGLRLVCYLGDERIALALGRGPQLIAASGLRTGAAELLRPEGSDAATKQLGQRINAFLRAQDLQENAPLEWAWCGPGAGNDEAPARLAAELASIRRANVFTHRDPSTFLARAVAARAVRGDSSNCSLLSKGGEPEKLVRLKRGHARRAPLVLAASAILLLGVNVAWNIWLARQRDSLQAVIQSRAAQLADTEQLPLGQEVLVAGRILKERAPAYAPFRAALEPPLLKLLDAMLKEASAQGVTFESLQLGERAIIALGSAADWKQAESFSAALSTQGWLPELQRRAAGEESRTCFSLRASQ